MTGRAGRAVFLDRDGVINRAPVRKGKPFPPSSVAELEILAGAADACNRLRAAGFILVVVSNQPDIARGTTSFGSVDEINHAVRRAVPVQDIRVCPHDDADGCQCRKPAPGLLLDAAAYYNISLSNSFMIGDRWRDIEAGRRAGCHTVFIDHEYRERRPDKPDKTVSDLAEAADWILEFSSLIQEAHLHG